MIRIQDIDPDGKLEGSIYLLTFSLGTTLVIGEDEEDVIAWATHYFGAYFGPYECVETDAMTVECMLVQRCLIHNTGVSYRKHRGIPVVSPLQVVESEEETG